MGSRWRSRDSLGQRGGDQEVVEGHRDTRGGWGLRSGESRVVVAY